MSDYRLIIDSSNAVVGVAGLNSALLRDGESVHQFADTLAPDAARLIGATATVAADIITALAYPAVSDLDSLRHEIRGVAFARAQQWLYDVPIVGEGYTEAIVSLTRRMIRRGQVAHYVEMTNTSHTIALRKAINASFAAGSADYTEVHQFMSAVSHSGFAEPMVDALAWWDTSGNRILLQNARVITVPASGVPANLLGDWPDDIAS